MEQLFHLRKTLQKMQLKKRQLRIQPKKMQKQRKLQNKFYLKKIPEAAMKTKRSRWRLLSM